MEQRKLGRSELHCSAIALGTWAFNAKVYGPVAVADATSTVRRALDEGITLFDTAPLYGSSEEDGICEQILGQALGTDREGVLISTKFGRRPTTGNKPEFDGASAIASVEASLRRLGTDRIDVLFFHSPFGEHEIDDDVWEALDQLRRAGKVRAIGHSISKVEDTAQMARAWAESRRIDVIQVVLSLLNRETQSLIEELADEGVGVLARESLANGFLSGTVAADTVFPPGSLNARYSGEQVAARVEQVERLSFLVDGAIHSLPQAAMRWVLDQRGVSSVLTGARTADEVSDCAAAALAPSYTPEILTRAREIHKQDFSAA
jgi:aryl-alcohol dehydrogenase-like predicted oxidoreductase